MVAKGQYSKVGQLGILNKTNKQSWIKELTAWLGSLMLLICVVVILAVYQNKARPSLKGGITLNALIAVIIKVGLTLLVVPLSAALGQWKWLRIRTSRSLKEFAAISDAVGSPWSSVTLLARCQGGFIAATGALLVLSAQAIETFVQQSVRYPVELMPKNGRAALPVSDYFLSQAPVTGQDAPPDFSMKAAVYNGLFATVSNTRFPVIPFCDGDSCSWQDYYTLGFCSSCENITNQVQTVKTEVHYTLPNGLVLNTGGSATTQATHNYNASITGASSIDDDPKNTDDGTYNLEMTFLATSQRQSSVTDGGTVITTSTVQPVAGRCHLKLCIKKFENAYFDQRGLEETESSGPSEDLSFFEPDSVPESNHTYSANDQSWQGFAYWLKTLLSGTYSSPDGFGETFESKTDSRDAIFQVLIGERGSLDLQSLFENVAHSLTFTMRTFNSKLSGGPEPVATGVTNFATPVVKVEWGWLTFPIGIWTITLGYLLAMMFMNRGLPLWKDQIIATLCHGLDSDTLNEVANLKMVSEMEDKANALHVKLVDSGNGSKLSKHGAAFVLESR